MLGRILRGPHAALYREGIVVFAVAMLAMFVAVRYVRTFRAGGEQPGFYQEMFAPAVMQACGRGFVNPAAGTVPTLEAFLATRIDAFDCRVVSPRVASIAMTPMQEVHRYLLMAAAACWRLAGVRWSALDWLAGGLFASTAVALYAACRVVAGTALSAVLTLLAIASPLQLANLPHLRDYSKAPFFAASAAGLAWLMTPRRPRRILAVSVAVGAWLGVGIGFRTDVMLYLLPFAFGLLVCSPEALPSPWRVRAMALALSVGACVAIAWPILRVYSSGQSLWHVALLGLTNVYDAPEHLGIRRSLYEFGDQYLDQYVHSVVNNFWVRVHHTAMSDAAYASASGEYYRRLFLMFPGDFVTHAWAAVLRSFQVPFDPSAVRIVPFGISAGWLRNLFAARWWLFSWLQLLALPMLVALAIGLSTRRRLAAVVLLGFVALSAGITTLQFQPRHYFHIELLVYWILAFAGGWLTRLLSDRKHRLPVPAAGSDVRVLSAVAFAMSIVAVVVLPLIGLRMYQSRSVSVLLTQYEAAPVLPIDVRQRTSSGVAYFEMPSLSPAPAASTQMLVTTLDGGTCRDSVDLTFRYINDMPGMAPFTRVMRVDMRALDAQVTKVMFPAYFTHIEGEGNVSFVGLEVPEHQRQCIRSLSRFSDPEAFPLLLTTMLPEHWRTLPLYERIDSIESR